MEAAPNMVNFVLTKGLLQAFKSMIIPSDIRNKGAVMPQNKQKAVMPDPLEDPEAFAAACTDIFAEAQQDALQENKHHNVASWGTKDGKPGYLTPSGRFVRKDLTLP